MAGTACVESRSASIAANCENSAVQVNVFSTSKSRHQSRGFCATAYPSRHPVIANDFENPSMMTVRSAIPGSAQMDLIFAAEQDARVNFVGNHPQVVLLRQCRRFPPAPAR